MTPGEKVELNTNAGKDVSVGVSEERTVALPRRRLNMKGLEGVDKDLHIDALGIKAAEYDGIGRGQRGKDVKRKKKKRDVVVEDKSQGKIDHFFTRSRKPGGGAN